MNDNKNKIRSYTKALRVNLNDELTEDFELIKNHYGMVSDSDMVRFLIKEKKRDIENIKFIKKNHGYKNKSENSKSDMED